VIKIEYVSLGDGVDVVTDINTLFVRLDTVLTMNKKGYIADINIAQAIMAELQVFYKQMSERIYESRLRKYMEMFLHNVKLVIKLRCDGFIDVDSFRKAIRSEVSDFDEVLRQSYR